MNDDKLLSAICFFIYFIQKLEKLFVRNNKTKIFPFVDWICIRCIK